MLHVGCGISELSFRLAERGLVRRLASNIRILVHLLLTDLRMVENVDFAEQSIKRMQDVRHKQTAPLSAPMVFRCIDICQPLPYPEGAFHFVLEKGHVLFF